MTDRNGQTFRPADNVHTRRVDRELVLLDLSSGQYYSLDPVGAAIWDELSRGHTAEQAVETLLLSYSVTREQLDDDVRALIETLVSRGLLVVGD